MRYLITGTGINPFFTNFLNPENITPGMVVCDLFHYQYTTDGTTWHKIDFDTL